jgi:hypothetical protein
MLKETLAALNLTVEYDGERRDVRLKPGDMVRFETHFGRSLFDGADLNEAGEPVGLKFGLTELFYLAFCALRREGVVDDFDVFCDKVDDVDVGEGAAAPKAV